jgi:hypothetical protein
MKRFGFGFGRHIPHPLAFFAFAFPFGLIHSLIFSFIHRSCNLPHMLPGYQPLHYIPHTPAIPFLDSMCIPMRRKKERVHIKSMLVAYHSFQGPIRYAGLILSFRLLLSLSLLYYHHHHHHLIRASSSNPVIAYAYPLA